MRVRLVCAAMLLAVGVAAAGCTDSAPRSPPTTHPSAHGREHRARSRPASTPATTYNIRADQARQIATVVGLVRAYNRGDLHGVLSRLTDNVGWSDCKYRNGTMVDREGKAAVAKWLRRRFAQNDRLSIGSVANLNPQGGHTHTVTFARRGSDLLRSLGFPDGIAPTGAVKVRFATPESINGFSMAPYGADASRVKQLCTPAASPSGSQ